MRNTIFLLVFLISGVCFSQNPDPFWDGIRTKLVQPDTLSTFDRDALTPKLGTILYHKDTGVSRWEQWNGTAWVPFGESVEWGNITGTLSDQTDLQTQLNSKENIGVTDSLLQDKRNGVNAIRRIQIEKTKKVALIGNSITHGAFATSNIDDSYAGLLRKSFQKELNTEAFGFQTIKDDYAWTNDMFHEVTERNGDWTEDTDSPYSECGYSIHSDTPGDFIEIKIPTGQQERFIVKYLRNPSNTTSFDIYINDIFSKNVSRASGFFFDYEDSSTGLIDSGDGFCYVKIEVVSGDVYLTGMKYVVTNDDYVIDVMAQSGRKTLDIDDNTITNIFSSYGFVIWALGHNDQSLTGGDITTVEAKIDKVLTDANFYGVPVLFLDFLWREDTDNYLREKLKAAAETNPLFDIIQFPSYFKLDQSAPSTTYLTTDLGLFDDGSHPNDAGHKYIFETVARNLQFNYSTKSLIEQLSDFSGDYLKSNENTTFTGDTLFIDSNKNIQLGGSSQLRGGLTSGTRLDLYQDNFYIRNATTTRFTFNRTTGNFTATGTGEFGGTVSGSDPVNNDDFVTKGYGDANYGGTPYLKYVALVSQDGVTSAPTAIVLENTLGGTVVWTRSSTGIYRATLSSTFTLNKTACFTTPGVPGNSSVINEVRLYRATADYVVLETIADGSPDDIEIYNMAVEIRVYP